MGYFNNILLIIFGALEGILGLFLGIIGEKRKKIRKILLIILMTIFIIFAVVSVRQIIEQQKEESGEIENLRLTIFFHVDPPKIATIKENDKLNYLIQNERINYFELNPYLRIKDIRESIMEEFFVYWESNLRIYDKLDLSDKFEEPPLLHYKTLNNENIDDFGSTQGLIPYSHLGRSDFYVSYLIPLDNPKLQTIYDFNNKGIFLNLHTNQIFHDLNVSGIKISFDDSSLSNREKVLIFEYGKKDENLNSRFFYLIEKENGFRIWNLNYITPVDSFT